MSQSTPAPHACHPFAGRVALWNGPVSIGDSGAEALSGHIGWLIFEAQRTPSTTPSVADVSLAFGELAQALHRYGTSIGTSIRLYASPMTGHGVALRVFFAIRVFAETPGEIDERRAYLQALIPGRLPSAYRWIDRSDDQALVDQVCLARGAASIVEALPPERFVRAGIDPRICGYSTIYLPPRIVPAAADFMQACASLARQSASAPMLFDITMVPTVGLSTGEHAALSDLQRVLRMFCQEQILTLPGGFSADGRFIPPTKIQVAADPNAIPAAARYSEIQRMRSSSACHFLVAIRVLRWDEEPATATLSAFLTSAFKPEFGNWQTVSVTDGEMFRRARDAVAGAFISPSIFHQQWNHQGAPQDLKRLHRVFTAQEVAGVFTIPVSRDGRWPGQFEVRPQRAQFNLRELLPDPHQEWQRDSEGRGITTPIGWDIETLSPASFTLDDESPHALVIGRSGSGKSSLLHAMVLGLASRRSPDHLDLYLMDLKDGGVEFERYTSLPQARVVASASDPIFALSVLRSLVELMAERGKSQRGYSDGPKDLRRSLIVIDEYQVLFQFEDISQPAKSLIHQIATRGRSVGLHLVLATQSIESAGTNGLSSATLDQFAFRALLGAGSPGETQGLFPAAMLPENGLGRGEALIGARVEGRIRHSVVRVAFAASAQEFAEDRARQLSLLSRAAESVGARHAPILFNGDDSADPMGSPYFNNEVCDIPRLVLGEVVDAPPWPMLVELTQSVGAHVLLIDAVRSNASMVLEAACVSFCASTPSGIVWVVDLDPHANWTQAAERSIGGAFERFCAQDLGELLDRVLMEIRGRSSDSIPMLVVLNGLHGARGLSVRGHISSRDSELLAEILDAGPIVGVHVIAWSLTEEALRSTVPDRAIAAFGTVLAGNIRSAASLFGVYGSVPTVRPRRVITLISNAWAVLRLYDFTAWQRERARRGPLRRGAPIAPTFSVHASSAAVPTRALASLLMGELWQHQSSSGIEAPVGTTIALPTPGGFAPRNPRPDVALFRFDDGVPHALVGGSAGSGKSSFLHTLILSLCQRYAPSELSLYLVDLKQGVEFEPYVRLPHARAVAVESNRHFALSVIEELVRICTERYELFRQARVGNIKQYRSRETMPRVLLIIDEFQSLFGADDGGHRVKNNLEYIAEKGRAVGVHFLLATQSYARPSIDWLSSATVAQAPQRLALRMPSSAAYGLLERNHGDLDHVRGIGEGVWDLHNERRILQVAFDADVDESMVRQRRDEAVERFCVAWMSHPKRPTNWVPPVIYDSRSPPDVSSNPHLMNWTDASEIYPFRLSVGQAIDARGSHVSCDLLRECRSNVLIYGSDRTAARAIVLSAIRSAILQHAHVTLVSAPTSPEILSGDGVDRIVVDSASGCASLDPILAALSCRQISSETLVPHLVVLWGGQAVAQAIGAPESSSDYGLGIESRVPLKRLVKDGPTCGLHILAWSDTSSELERLFGQDVFRSEFDMWIKLGPDPQDALERGTAILRTRQDQDQKGTILRPYSGISGLLKPPPHQS